MNSFRFHATLHITAYALIVVAETIRPGFVTGAVNLGWVLFGSVLLLTAHLRVVTRSHPDPNSYD